MGFRVPVTDTKENTVEKQVSDTSLIDTNITPTNLETQPPLLRGAPKMPENEEVLGIPKNIYDNVLNEVAPDPMVPKANVFRGPLETEVGGVSTAQYNKIVDNVANVNKGDSTLESRVLARNVDPKQAQNILDISERLKMTPEEARSYLETHPIDELKALPELEDIQEKYPGIYTWSQNPENMKILLQDPVWAKKLEDTRKKFNSWDKTEQYVKDAGRAFVSGVSQTAAQGARIPALINAVALLPHNLIMDTKDQITVPEELINNPVAKYFDEVAIQYGDQSISQDALDSISEKVKAGDYTGAARDISLRVIQSAPSTLTAIVGAVVGAPAEALILMGTLSGAGTYAGSKEMGASESSATLHGVISGTVESAMEKIGTMGVLKSWEHALTKIYGKSTTKKILKEMVKQTAYASVSEGWEEFATSILQDTSAYYTGVDNKAIEIEGMIKRATGAGIVGAASGGALTSPGAVLSFIAKKRVSNIAERVNNAQEVSSALNDAETVKNLREQKKESNVPNEYDQFVNDLNKRIEESTQTNEAPEYVQPETIFDEKKTDEINAKAEAKFSQDTKRPDTMRFNLDDFNRIAGSKGVSPEQIAKELGPIAEQNYNDAVENGQSSFTMPYNDYYKNSDNHPELDSILYMGSNIHNEESATVEADRLKSVFTERMGMRGDENAPKAEPTKVEYPKGEPQDGDPVLRSIQLLQVGRSPEEQNIFRDIKKKLTATLKNTKTPAEVADIVAELQFRHVRFRAEQLGVNILEIHDQTDIGYQAVPGDNAIAYFQRGERASMPRSEVVFGKETKPHAVIHEFAHSWLHNMSIDYGFISRLQTLTEGQQEYKEAMEIVANMFNLQNVGQLNDLSKEQRTKVHETFAQTAESFFLRGDFADSKIKKVFDQMRKYMVSVANLVGMAYAEYPPMKLTPETQRMFKILVEGTGRVENQMNKMFPDVTINNDIMGPDAPKYFEAIKDSFDNAVSTLYANIMERSFAEREKLIEKAIKTIDEKAQDIINNRPAMVLHEAIKKMGESYKITYSSVLEVLAQGNEEELKKLKENIPPGVIAGQKKAGIDVRDIMKGMGITDNKRMIELLLEMNKREEMINALSERMIDEQFPAFKSDEDIHNEAVKAIQDSGREKILDMELKFLKDQHPSTFQKMNAELATNPERLRKKGKEAVINAASEKVLLSTALGQTRKGIIVTRMRVRDFLVEMASANKKATEYMKARDYENAFVWKQNEIILHHAAKIARTAISSIDNTVTQIKTMEQAKLQDVAKGHDVDIYSFGKNIIKEFISGHSLSKPNINSFRNKSIIDSERIHLINTGIDIVNGLMTKPDGTRIAPMNANVRAIMALGALIKLIRSTSAETRRFELGLMKDTVENISIKASAEIGGKKSTDPTTSMKKGLAAKWQSGLINVRTLFGGMYDSEEAFAKSVIAQILNAVSDAQGKFQHEKEIDEKEIMKAISEISKNNPEMQSILSAITKRTVDLFGNRDGKPIAAKEIDFTFANEGELLQMLLYLGSESGRIKVGQGGLQDSQGNKTGQLGYFHPETGIYEMPKVDQMIKRMIEDGVLRKEHFDFAQTIWDIYERHHANVKKGIRATKGYDIGKIEAKPFEVFGKTYRGGYAPVSKATTTYEDLKNQFSDFAIGNENTYVDEMFPHNNTSFAKERSTQVYPVSLNLGLLRMRLNSVYRAAYLVPTMFQVGKVLGSENFINTMEQRRPGAMDAIIKPWFKRTVAQEYTTRNEDEGLQAVDKIVHNLRRNNRVVAFAFNYASVAKQFIGIVPANAIVGTKHVASAIKEVGLRPSNSIKEIMEVSPRMRQRMEYNARLAIKSFEDLDINIDKITKGNNVIDKIVYTPIQIAQNYVDAVVFTAASNQARYEFGMENPKKIADYAASVVERTQMSANISDRTNIMHGSEIKRMFTDFMSVPLAMYGLNYESKMRGMSQSQIKRIEMKIKMALLTIIIPSILGSLIAAPFATGRILLGGAKKKEEEEYLGNMALDIGAEALGVMFPVSGRALSAITDLFGYHRGVTEAVPAVRGVKSLSDATLAVGKRVSPWSNKKELTQGDLKNIADGLTVVSGLPVSAANKVFKIMVDIDPKLKHK